MTNPFSLFFGRKPLQYVSRLTQANQIIEAFGADYPTSQINIIMGVRGSGKTVLMTSIKDHFSAQKEWIPLELSIETDIMQSLAAQLYQIPELHALFIKAEVDFSAFGLGVSFKNSAPVTDIGTAVEIMLKELKKIDKKLLICIDEVVNNNSIRVFASYFQIYIREELPIFSIMTGLYENIEDLQNTDTLTFLYRAPKTRLTPLDIVQIERMYSNILEIDAGTARKMALLTCGYSFAFQLLGHLAWEHKSTSTDELIPEFDHYLSDYVYTKIWSEIPFACKRILIVASKHTNCSVKTIRDELNMTSGTFSKLRDYIKRKDIIDDSAYGKIIFTLPRFAEFVLQYDYLLED